MPAHSARLVTAANIDLQDFDAVFDYLEIESGAIVWVQSGTYRLGYDVAQSLEFIASLRRRIGSRGALFMPSFPFVETTWTPDPEQLFDVAKTPSACGLISELFRRQRDVHRSESFYFPVAGCGRSAKDILADQLHNEDVFGPESVYGRLIEANARFLGFGVGLNTSSFAHVPDWRLKERFLVPLYPSGRLRGRVRTQDGVVHEVSSPMIEDIRLSRSFVPWQMMDGDPVLGPMRRVVASKNATGDVFRFSYPIDVYFERAMLLGSAALERNETPPWLKEGAFDLLADTGGESTAW